MTPVSLADPLYPGEYLQLPPPFAQQEDFAMLNEAFAGSQDPFTLDDPYRPKSAGGDDAEWDFRTMHLPTGIDDETPRADSERMGQFVERAC